MSIIFRTGDLFDSGEQTIVNTINCQGVMGKGIALEFKRRFPLMFRDYVNRCKLPSGHEQKVVTGRPYLFEESGRLILNFPTKNHWRFPSKMSYIEDGLAHFFENYKYWGITSIAFPRLGCENGGLDWAIQVLPLMTKYLDLVEIPVTIVSWNGMPASPPVEYSVMQVAEKQLGLPGLSISPAAPAPASGRRHKASGRTKDKSAPRP